MDDRLRVRTVRDSDVAAIRRVQNRAEEALGGTEMFSDGEIAEELDRTTSAGGAVVVEHGADVVGAAWWWGTSTFWLVDPAAPDSTHQLLLTWLEEAPPATAEADARDTRSLGAFAARGWRHTRSSFDLHMDAEGAALLTVPTWPPGVRARPWATGDAEAVHDLIYRRAGWAEVPGHHERALGEWQAIFAGSFLVPDLQVLAVAGGDLVIGAAVTRIWDDGTGWVSQLAVDRGNRGLGLGRRLLVTALTGLRDHGATELGLSVSAENRNALGLYQSVGLTVAREWLTHTSD